MPPGTEFLGLNRRLEDFFHWALSDLLSNTTRGMIAEYLVRCSIGLDGSPSLEWDYLDIRTESGGIEVKFTGLAQSWATKTSSSPRFDIKQRANAWDAVAGDWIPTDKPTRHADLYVFCLHKEKDREVANALDTQQWSFWIVPTRWLNETLGDQQSVGLSRIAQHHQETTFEELGNKIQAVLEHKA